MSRLLTISLYTLIFLSVSNFTVAIMAGTYIARSLGGSPEIAIYNICFYGLGNAFTFGLASYCKDRFGARNVLTWSLFAFTILTILSSLAPTFIIFVLIRLLTGVSCGMFFPISFTLLQQNCDPEKKDFKIALVAFLATIAPVIGACFGGVFAYEYHWSWIFYLQLPILFGVAPLILTQTDQARSKTPPFDFTGYLFYIVGVSSLLTACTLGQQLDWQRSPTICFCFFISILTLPFFILWELKHPNPFMDIRLFKNSVFALSVFLVGFLFSAYFGMILLLTLWLHLYASYTPMWISLLVLHMIAAGGVLFFMLRKNLRKVSSFSTISIAVAFFAISCFYSTYFNVDINFGRLAFARILAGFGLAFFLFPLLLLCLHSLPPEKTSQGGAIFQSVRLLSGGFGCAIYTTLWYRRQIFYHSRLGETLTPYSKLTQESLNQFSSYGNPIELLETALQKQASSLALADCFYLMGWVMLIVLAITLFYTWTHRTTQN